MSVITESVLDQPEHETPPDDPAARSALVPAVIIGLVLDIGLRGGVANGVVLVAVTALIVLLRSGDRLQAEARLVASAAAVPTVFLAVRSSPWLAWSNTLLALGLLGAAVVHGRRGSVFDTSPVRLMRRFDRGVQRGVRSLSIVSSLAPDVSDERRAGVLRASRGLLVVVPVVLVLTALLASADAVFASLLTPDLNAGPAFGHLALTALFAPLVFVFVGSVSDRDAEPGGRGSFGVVEVSTMLGAVGAVLGLFVVSQMVALTGAGERLIESAGLTPAEYARSGFFQLCWAAGLLVVFLAVVRRLAYPEALRHPLVVGLGGLVPALALGLVVVSLRRMALYDDAFGLTMLRLWVVGTALWVGAVLVMTALRNLGVGADRQWLVGGAGVAALVLVTIADLMNPEAFVARHNLDRARGGAELDIGYLTTLSDDVVPVVADALDAETDPDRRGALVHALRCGADATGAAAVNLSASRAADVRDSYCHGRVAPGVARSGD